MIDVLVTTEIARDPADVFAFLSDSSNNPQWQKGMKSCAWTSEPPIGLGSTYDQQASFMGRAILSSFEVTEFEPGRKVRIKTTKSTMPLDITRSVDPSPSGLSIVTANIRGGPEGLMRFLDPLAQRMVKKSVTADYSRLKELLEG
ncbi:MAG: SRPBCC family protein [Acidimicrobiales bacterium]